MWSPFVSLPFQKLGRRKCNFHDRREFECINIACGPWIWHGLEAFCSLGRQSQSLGPASKEAESAAPANVSCCSEGCKCCSRFCKGTAPHTDGNHLWLLGVGLSLLTTRAARTLTWPLQSVQLKHSSRLLCPPPFPSQAATVSRVRVISASGGGMEPTLCYSSLKHFLGPCSAWTWALLSSFQLSPQCPRWQSSAPIFTVQAGSRAQRETPFAQSPDESPWQCEQLKLFP